MKIPYEKLSPELLRGIIEDFVLREGTDYGYQEYTLEEKIEQVEKQIKKGEVRIVFDQVSETCTLVRSSD